MTLKHPPIDRKEFVTVSEDASCGGKVVADSISPDGVRLTTIHLRYPRMIHAEIMTHRVFSRNGRSSRAVPVLTLLKENHYTPDFKLNKAGMVPEGDLDPAKKKEAIETWENLVEQTKAAVAKLHELGVHKQWANRPLEWFGYIDVLISSTDWVNFMALRDEPSAQQEIQSVAEVIKKLLAHSQPIPLGGGQWHLPYVNKDEYEKHDLDVLRKLSVARCARLSYKPFDGNDSLEKEFTRYERLMLSRPVHASPAEHIATPDFKQRNYQGIESWRNQDRWGNFYGWQQFRKMIPYNTIEEDR